MKKFTDYKYRKLRKTIRTASVARSVKNLLLCAVHDYQYSNSRPARDTFQEGASRCLIGAGLHDKGIRPRGGGLTWQDEATKAFGITYTQADHIVDGFDYRQSDIVGLGTNRTARLAHKLAQELVG